MNTLEDRNLCGAVLFSNYEPCPTRMLVYAIPIEDTMRLGSTRIQVDSRELVQKSPVMVEIVGDVLKQECQALCV